MTRFSPTKAAASKRTEQPPLHRGHQLAPCEAKSPANPHQHSNRRAEEAADFTPGQPMDRRVHGNQNKAAPIGPSATLGDAVSILTGEAGGPNLSNPFTGNHHRALANQTPGLTERQVPPVNRSKIYGPPTTNRMEGAGGPHNEWDAKIAAAHRRGNPLLAKRLQAARARINLAFELLEPVWVPTPHQLLMLALRADAEVTGIATVAA